MKCLTLELAGCYDYLFWLKVSKQISIVTHRVIQESKRSVVWVCHPAHVLRVAGVDEGRVQPAQQLDVVLQDVVDLPALSQHFAPHTALSTVLQEEIRTN